VAWAALSTRPTLTLICNVNVGMVSTRARGTNDQLGVACSPARLAGQAERFASPRLPVHRGHRRNLTLGGKPDLPAALDWPRGGDGPLAFCGQVNTRDVEPLFGVDGWQPGERLLLFFAGPEDAVDAPGRVLSAPLDYLEPRDIPADLPGVSRWEESALDVVPVLSLPMAELLDADLDLDLDADEWATWERLFRALGCGEPTITAGHHQLLAEPGWAPIATACSPSSRRTRRRTWRSRTAGRSTS
jgi:Domain of unknown function (DUF1963)